MAGKPETYCRHLVSICTFSAFGGLRLLSSPQRLPFPSLPIDCTKDRTRCQSTGAIANRRCCQRTETVSKADCAERFPSCNFPLGHRFAAYGSCTQPQLLPNLLRDYLNPICGYVDLATNTIVNNAVLLLGVVLLLVQLAHSGFAPVLMSSTFSKVITAIEEPIPCQH